MVELTLDQPISVMRLSEAVAPQHLRQTGNAPGARSVDDIAPPGRYLRKPPLHLDVAELDDDRRDWVREVYSATEQSFRTLRLIAFKDACVVGQGSVVTRDGTLLFESAAEFLAHKAAPDGFSFETEHALRIATPHRRNIPGPVLLLKRPWWRNYGHLLVDCASLLALSSRMRVPRGTRLVLGKADTPRMRQLMAELVARLAPHFEVIEHADDEAWHCEELYYPEPVHIPPLHKHPLAMATLRALLLPRGPASGDARIFVSRGPHPARRLENEAELAAIAASHGYRMVRPEELSLEQQMALFQSSTCIVGVKGAALTNLLFCAAGTRCLVLSPSDFGDPFFWDLASHANVAYSEIFGRTTTRSGPAGQNAFRVDPEKFSSLLPV